MSCFNLSYFNSFLLVKKDYLFFTIKYSTFFLSTLIGAFLISAQGISQSAGSTDFIANNLTVYPVSPEAATLGKYGELPVNLATGRINFTVPLYTIKIGDFEWPIYLSYNYSGLKTEEDPGMTGLGWDLIANGRITIDVRGLPDELYGYHQSVYPYLSGDLNTLSQDQKTKKLLTLFDAISSGIGFDSQPDLYLINAGGLSGSYVLDKNKEPVFQNHRNYIFNDHKTIIDENGIIFRFEEEEKGITATSSGEVYEIVNSKMLNQIDLPDNSMNIEFVYANESSKNEYQKIVNNSTKLSGIKSSLESSYTSTSVKTRPLNKISFPNGYIVLDVSQFISNNSTGNTLNRITVYNLSDTPILSYKFEYSNASKFKKVLQKISKTTTDVEEDYYDFEYHDTDDLQDNFSYTAQDFWGYYNGITATNLVLSSRESVFDETKKGALTKITFPTGGTSNIEYEQNQVLADEITRNNLCNYTHNKSIRGFIDVLPNGISEIDTIIDIGSSQIVRVLMTGTVVDNSNPTELIDINYSLASLSSEGSPDCFNMLDAELSIRGNTFISGEANKNTIFSKEQVGYISDGKVSIKGQFFSDSSKFRLSYTISFEDTHIPSQINKLIGGIRVKSVTDRGAEGNSIKKHYKYILENASKSSGNLLSYPNFKHTIYNKDGSFIQNNGKITYQNARSTNSFTSYRDSAVLYERIEVFKNSGDSGKEIATYSKANEHIFPFPYVPNISENWLKGKLLKKNIYKKHGLIFRLVSSQENIYERVYPFGLGKSSSKHAFGLAVSRNQFAYFNGSLLSANIMDYAENSYVIYPKAFVLDKTVTKEYNDLEQPINEVTTTYHYDSPETQLQKKITRIGNDRELHTEYIYPYHSSNHPLTALNRIANPIGVKTHLKKGTASPDLLSYQNTVYDNTSNLVIPSKVQIAKGSTAVLEDRLIFGAYDSYGNPMEISRPGGSTTVTLWGYNGQYPIAKIENTTYAQVRQALGNPTTIDATYLSKIDALRTSRPAWQITTYEHYPLVGVKRITQPNGVSTHYEYNGFNRLKTIKDRDKKLLQDYEYHYSKID